MQPAEAQYEIVRMQVNDLQSLNQFYQKHFPDNAVLNNEALWQWSFVQNPLIGDKIPFFVIKLGDEIVGAIGYIPVKFYLGTIIYSGCHPINFFIDPRFKGLPALRLFRKVLAECEIIFASYLSEDASKLLTTSGFVDLSEHLRDYYYPLKNHQPTIESARWSIKTKSWILYWIRTSWLYTLQFFCGLQRNISHQVHHTWSDDLVPEDATPAASRISIVKDKIYLRWRYADSPRLNCVYFSVVKNGLPAGLAILHFDHNKAVILDIVVRPHDPVVTLCLISQILLYCKKQDLHLLTIVVLNKYIESKLKLLGFGKNISSYGLMAFAKDKKLKAMLSNADSWDFMTGNTDIY